MGIFVVTYLAFYFDSWRFVLHQIEKHYIIKQRYIEKTMNVQHTQMRDTNCTILELCYTLPFRRLGGFANKWNIIIGSSRRRRGRGRRRRSG